MIRGSGAGVVKRLFPRLTVGLSRVVIRPEGNNSYGKPHTMTKLEVATALRERTGLSQKQALECVEIFLDSIKDALKDGEKVSLVGFGTFYLKEKGERNGRNPRTGEKIVIPPKSIVAFKPGKEFREQVNEAEGPAED